MKINLKDYFFAHKGNLYKPAIFAIESVMIILMVLFIFESIYVFHVNVVTKNTGFTAAVLPAALNILTNIDRSIKGLGQLERDIVLDKAAQEKANDMASNGYFAHVSPTGKTPWYWLDQMNYKYDYAGENLAVNFTDSKDVEIAWMNSPSHRDNIIKTEYTKIGIAVAQGMYQGQPTTFVVQLFAKPTSVSATVISNKTPTLTTLEISTTKKTPVAIVEPTKEIAKTPPSKVLGATQQSSDTQIITASEKSVTPTSQTLTPIENTLIKAAGSPTYTFEYILIVFIIGILLLLGLATMMHIWVGVRYIEVLAGGAALVFVALILITFNNKSATSVILPNSSQSASIIMSL